MYSRSDRHRTVALWSAGIRAFPDGLPAAVPMSADGRPEFMALLGLLPPYTEEDVHKAYKARAISAHPDRGGSKADFIRLQEAYESAQDFVKFTEGRRLWLAKQVEPYLRQQEVIGEVERRGGTAGVETLDWMERSFGDFSHLTDRLRSLRLRDCADGDAVLKLLADAAKDLRYLIEIDLAGSQVTDTGLASLSKLQNLQRLNLARTRVTARGLDALSALEDLEWLNIAGTSVGWWSRYKLGKRLKTAKVVATEAL